MGEYGPNGSYLYGRKEHDRNDLGCMVGVQAKRNSDIPMAFDICGNGFSLSLPSCLLSNLSNFFLQHAQSAFGIFKSDGSGI